MAFNAASPAVSAGRPNVACAEVTAGTAGGIEAVREYGLGTPYRQLLVKLTNTPITLTDNGATGSGGVKILDFPDGVIKFDGAICDLTITGPGSFTDAGLVGSIGTVTAAADGTLTSTEANIMPSTSCAMTSGAATLQGKPTASAWVDGSSTAADVYLNLASANDPVGNKSITVSGYVLLSFVNLGDIPITY